MLKTFISAFCVVGCFCVELLLLGILKCLDSGDATAGAVNF